MRPGRDDATPRSRQTRLYTDGMTGSSALLSMACIGLALSVGAAAQRAGAFGGSRDHPAIAYSTTPARTAVEPVDAALASGSTRFSFDATTGYLRPVLEALGLAVDSQVLVYSGTSFQARYITKRNPRAIYFNDNVSVAWVRGGDVLEIAAQDPRQGTIFYTLEQMASTPPRFTRQPACLSCHLSWDTLAVPGPTVLTAYPRRKESDYADGYAVDHRAPVHERWGGWYATGAQVPPSMANLPLLQPTQPASGPVPVRAPARLTTEIEDGYPVPTSDVVALLVLDHQVRATNLLTRAGWEYRQAEGDGWTGKSLPPRAQEAVEELADYLLMVHEAPLTAPVTGNSGFAERFAALGPKDAAGRSLRQLDLQSRLFRYPLSYMVYSSAFDGLPGTVKAAVWDRIAHILDAPPAAAKYAHLTAAARQAIREIVQATADVPARF